MVENENYSFETLFENKEEQVLTCYKAIIQNIETYAEPIIEVKKTTLHIIKKRAFLGVHPMKKWLDLNIVSDHPLSYSKLMIQKIAIIIRFVYTQLKKLISSC